MQIPGSPTRRHHHRGLRCGRSVRRLRHRVRRRRVGRRARRARLRVPGRGCPLRRAHDEAPRRLRVVAFTDPASGQGAPTTRGATWSASWATPSASRRMRMGLYYSGGYDWPYNGAVIRRAADVVLAAPDDAAYREYVTAHVLELIDRYRPSVLWNDISWPAGGNLAELFARYYNTVEDGVVNDRWLQPEPVRGAVKQTLLRFGGDLLQLLWPLIPPRRKRLTFGSPRHYDFRTPEYEVPHTVTERKWELARGVGHSFGANRYERPEDIITGTELVRMFCDVISKNGNLLIGVGPRPDGTVPESQQAPLRALGTWLSVNGEAVYGSRPWVMAESATAEGTPVRFTWPRGPCLRPGARHAALEADLLLRRRRLRGDAGAPGRSCRIRRMGGRGRPSQCRPAGTPPARPGRDVRRGCGTASRRVSGGERSLDVSSSTSLWLALQYGSWVRHAARSPSEGRAESRRCLGARVSRVPQRHDVEHPTRHRHAAHGQGDGTAAA